MAKKSVSEIQAWLAGWPEQREVLGKLIRERAKEDPGYSWLTAEREIMMMDGVLQRLTTIVKVLGRSVGNDD